MNTTSELLKMPELCALLKISNRTVYTWIKEKKIPYSMVGQQYRFDKDEIMLWTKDFKK